MTWNEFKSEVDRLLEEGGADGSVKIAWIDISYPDSAHARTSISVSVEGGEWLSVG